MAYGKQNLHHVLLTDCSDPDCELHNPDAIEDDDQRLTALAWMYVGMENLDKSRRDPSLDNTNILDSVRDELLWHIKEPS